MRLDENVIRKIIREVIERIGNEILNKKNCLDVYEGNKELQKCGTFEQYYDYVNSIFPNSKMKNIVYHGSTFEFTNFELGHHNTGRKANSSYYKAGFWFMKDKEGVYYYMDRFMCFLKNIVHLKKIYTPTLYSVKLNIQNPKIISRNGGRGVDNTPVNDAFANGNDCLVVKNVIDPSVLSDVYVVFEAKNIHILGNENDVRQFSNFCRKKNL